jgi:hypothetical protein
LSAVARGVHGCLWHNMPGASGSTAHSGRRSGERRPPFARLRIRSDAPSEPRVKPSEGRRERAVATGSGFRAASGAGRRPAGASSFIADQYTAGARGFTPRSPLALARGLTLFSQFRRAPTRCNTGTRCNRSLRPEFCRIPTPRSRGSESVAAARSDAPSEPRAKRAAGPRERAVSSRIKTPRERAVPAFWLPGGARSTSPEER